MATQSIATGPGSGLGEEVNQSGEAVLAVTALVVSICRAADSTTTGASLRQACKQTAKSLDWFDFMWCARNNTEKVQQVLTQHASDAVPTARIREVVLPGSLLQLYSCPPLLKWVVVQAARQGDAALLAAVLREDDKQQEQQMVGPD